MRLCDYILPLAVAFVNTKNRIFAIIFVAYLHHLWYYIFKERRCGKCRKLVNK
nr:MAG TPA: hypothetical protein [Caudoviricetes sp.]